MDALQLDLKFGGVIFGGRKFTHRPSRDLFQSLAALRVASPSITATVVVYVALATDVGNSLGCKFPMC